MARPTTPTVGYKYLADLPEPARFERNNVASSRILREERTKLEQMINARNSKQLNQPGQNTLKSRLATFRSTHNAESKSRNARAASTPPEQSYKKKMMAALKAYKTRTSWAKLTKKNAQYLAMKKSVLDEMPHVTPLNSSKLVSNDDLIKAYNNPMSNFRGGAKKTRKARR
jgi:hypothetical protein